MVTYPHSNCHTNPWECNTDGNYCANTHVPQPESRCVSGKYSHASAGRGIASTPTHRDARCNTNTPHRGP